MAFDQTVPNGNQTVGEAIASANANDVALKAQQDAHASDTDAHGVAVLRTSAAEASAHKADEANPHGIASIRSVANMARDEAVQARGSQSSLAARLSVALRNDGGLRLDAVSARWISNGESPTYVSQFQFSAPVDRVALFVPGAILRLTVSGDYVYALVASRSFSAGVTTVALDPTGPALAGGLSKVEIGLISYDYAHAAAIGQLSSDLLALSGKVAATAAVRLWASHEPALQAGAVVARFVAGSAIALPGGLSGSKLVAEIQATAVAVFSIQRNGVSVGTAQFSAGSKVATFTLAADLLLSGDDVLKVVAPATPDATLRGISIFLKGTLQ